MVIIREFDAHSPEILSTDGLKTVYKIELTRKELWDAYFEQEHNFDMEDVKIEIERRIGLAEVNTDEKLVEYLKECLNNEATVSDAAYIKRKYIDKYDMESSYAIEDAVKDYIVDVYYKETEQEED